MFPDLQRKYYFLSFRGIVPNVFQQQSDTLPGKFLHRKFNNIRFSRKWQELFRRRKNYHKRKIATVPPD